MKRILGCLLLALVALAAETPQELFEKGLVKERSEGNLKEAIQFFERAAETSGKDRALAAKALLEAGECHRKLGDADARTIFERVIRDYADQKEAVTEARARLGRSYSSPEAIGDRPVWTGPSVDLFGTVSPDGRSLTYVDWNKTGNLMVHDFAAGTDRPLTPNRNSYGEFGEAERSAVSKDGKQVAYVWETHEGVNELRVTTLQGTGIPESHTIFHHEDARMVAPHDWSPDGRWLAVSFLRKDGTGEIGLVGVHDGAWRPLRSTDWRGPQKIFFSPDGRYIGYDLVNQNNSDERDIFIMAVDASRETAAVVDRSQNYMMGWSPDGKDLLFASDRSGSMGLWALRVEDGRAPEPSRLIEAGIGSGYSLGLTASGTLYVFKDPSTRYVQVVPIDLNAGKLLPDRGDNFHHFVSSKGTPYWSPDGEYLAYRFCGLAGGGPCGLGIASLQTGEVRELWPRLSYLLDYNGGWSADGASFLTLGTDLKGRGGQYFRINAQTAEFSAVPGADRGILSPDEKASYRKTADGIFRRDLSTGQERQIYWKPAGATSLSGITVSPDSRSIVFTEIDDQGSAIFLMPGVGGAARPIWRAAKPAEVGTIRANWTPDGHAIIVPKKVVDAGKDHKELWLVSVDGSAPRKLDIDTSNWDMEAGFSLSPDGRRLAFVASAGKPGYEVWALDNYRTALKENR